MGRLHTTTVRFDADAWAALSAEADRLGVAKATYIREATLARVAGSGSRSELGVMQQRLASLERRVGRLAEALARSSRRTSPR